MTNERIEEIMEEAVRAAYEQQTEHIKSFIDIDSSVQTAIDGIDFSEVDEMTEKEAFEFYKGWANDNFRHADTM